MGAQTPSVRIKDVGKIIEYRDNQLLGYGLVVGLRNTGDSRSTGVTRTSLTSLLSKLGISANPNELNSRNVASVMVTADLAPFIKPGQRISVTVSALGDSSSLSGGTLLMTPLKGPDMRTYAVAQGMVIVNAINEATATSRLQKNQSTVGAIPDGAIVEAEVPITFLDQHNITIVLNEPNFITVSRASEAIQNAGFEGVRAIDANTIKIPLKDLNTSDLILSIAQIENIELSPDQSAKIVINSKTGTIIIGEKVRLFPVAITHGNLSIRINEDTGGVLGQETETEAISVIQQANELQVINPIDTLTSIVNSLNELGATPKDLISIIQALHQSGALFADVEVL